MASYGWDRRVRDQLEQAQRELKLALRVTIAGMLAYAVTKILDLHRAIGREFTAVVVMQASVGGSLKAAIERFSGTLVGAIYGGLIAAFVPHSSPLSLGVPSSWPCFHWRFWPRSKPAFRVAPITSLIMLLPPTGQAIGPPRLGSRPGARDHARQYRGVVVSLFVLPARAHTLMTEAAAKVVSLNADLFSVFIEELTADPQGRSAMQKLHPQIRSALKKAEGRGRRSNAGTKEPSDGSSRSGTAHSHALPGSPRPCDDRSRGLQPPARPVRERLSPSFTALHETTRHFSWISRRLSSIAKAPPGTKAFEEA